MENTTVGVNKVTGVIESFPSNLNTLWKSLNILYIGMLFAKIAKAIRTEKKVNKKKIPDSD